MTGEIYYEWEQLVFVRLADIRLTVEHFGRLLLLVFDHDSRILWFACLARLTEQYKFLNIETQQLHRLRWDNIFQAAVRAKNAFFSAQVRQIVEHPNAALPHPNTVERVVSMFHRYLFHVCCTPVGASQYQIRDLKDYLLPCTTSADVLKRTFESSTWSQALPLLFRRAKQLQCADVLNIGRNKQFRDILWEQFVAYASALASLRFLAPYVMLEILNHLPLIETIGHQHKIKRLVKMRQIVVYDGQSRAVQQSCGGNGERLRL